MRMARCPGSWWLHLASGLRLWSTVTYSDRQTGRRRRYMTVSSKKITGGAGAYFDYVKEAAGAFSYYKTGDNDVAFTEVWGALAPELGLEHGITKKQWTDLFNGCWNGEKVVQSGYRKVVDPETGETVTAPANNAMVDCMFSAPKGVSEAYARAATQEEADQI